MPKTNRYEQFAFAEDWASVSTITGMLEKPFLYQWYSKMTWEEALEFVTIAANKNFSHADIVAFFRDGKASKPQRINAHSKVIGNLIDNEICHYFGDKDTPEIDRKVLDHPETKEFYLQAIRNFHVVVDAIKPTSIMGQVPVYSMKNKYIGTFDRLLEVDGKLVLSDWKATNFLDYGYQMQLEAYFRALLEMIESGILKLEGKYATMEWHEYPMWIVQFPKKEVVNLEKNIIKLKSKDLRFQNFLNLLSFHYGKKEDEAEVKALKSLDKANQPKTKRRTKTSDK